MLVLGAVLRELWATPAVRWSLAALLAAVLLFVGFGEWKRSIQHEARMGAFAEIAARDDNLVRLDKERKDKLRAAYLADVAAARAERDKEKSDHAKTKIELSRIALSGNSGLRCPKPSPSAAVSAPAGDPEPGAGPGPAQDDRLVPEVADAFLGIIADRVQDVSDYNRLADRYDKLVEYCRASQPLARSSNTR